MCSFLSSYQQPLSQSFLVPSEDALTRSPGGFVNKQWGIWLRNRLTRHSNLEDPSTQPGTIGPNGPGFCWRVLQVAVRWVHHSSQEESPQPRRNPSFSLKMTGIGAQASHWQLLANRSIFRYFHGKIGKGPCGATKVCYLHLDQQQHPYRPRERLWAGTRCYSWKLVGNNLGKLWIYLADIVGVTTQLVWMRCKTSL